MYCDFCKTENSEENKTCVKCGKPLPCQESCCPECGLYNKAGAAFCNGCGTNLRTGAVREWIADNRYKITGIIKQGAMGAVYRSYDQRLNVYVAVKKLFNNGKNSDETAKFTEMFRREAEILASLNHPCLPKVSDYFSAPDENGRNSNFLVMNLIEGEDMESYLSGKKLPLPFDEVRDYLLKITDILEYLHSRTPPVIYRDLKPSNIMLRSEKLYLVDFGIAKIYEARKSGTMMGTAGYASPDQCRGTDHPSNDIYSLGALAHYLLTGLDPQNPDRPLFTFEPVSGLNPKIPLHISALIEAMTEIRISDRIQSPEKVRSLLCNGKQIPLNLNTSGKISKAGYFEAVKKGDYDQVLAALNQGLSIQETDDDGVMPLHYAVYSGNVPIINLLKERGAYLEVKDNKGWTPLHWGCAGGRTEGVRYLLEVGVTVNGMDKNWVSPLHVAVGAGNYHAVELLLLYGANPNEQDTDFWAPLHLASQRNDINSVKALLKGGAFINLMGKKGRTPLMLAASKGHERMVTYLLKNGANITAKDSKGKTAITLAAKNGHMGIADYLNSNVGLIDKLFG
ncbi:MAG: ankyrin repeat domain-containing protein [Firmicutes bacterium]|nr:ankyrin repeat domain-containing protein [Bacillota bacterium]